MRMGAVVRSPNRGAAVRDFTAAEVEERAELGAGLERGQVANARFPHAAGMRGKKRPVVVVQAEPYNRRLKHAVVEQLTTNLSDKDDPACLLIEAASAEGRRRCCPRQHVLGLLACAHE